MMIFILLLGGLFVALLIGGIILLLQQNDEGGLSLPGGSSPSVREVLDERYARGEITEEEYRRMVEQLERA